MKVVKSQDEFRECLLNQMHFKKVQNLPYYLCYENEQGELYHHYFRKNCYEFSIANYTISEDFHLAFSNSSRLIRFGIVYTGTTTFKIQGHEVDSFSPSSFFVIEENLSGKQIWKKGQHFHGAEVTFHADYFNQIFESIVGYPFDFSKIITNHTYHFLSIEMTRCLNQLLSLATHGNLTPVYLESKMLEFAAILYNEVYEQSGKSFYNQTSPLTVTVGNRTIRLTTTDLESIRQAHDILTEQYASPPTIDTLSKMVYLNTQKLKAGFQLYYHQTIGSYVTTLKMSAAADLLCTTDEHIHDIALQLGYSQPGNFVRMFRNYYGKTPLQYRICQKGG